MEFQPHPEKTDSSLTQKWSRILRTFFVLIYLLNRLVAW